MWIPSTGVKVYLGLGKTDMRKSIDSLSVLVSSYLEQNPFSGHLFAFCNGRRTILKILYWDRNGFCLWHKRLEKNRFRWPESEEQLRELSARELGWLLEGLDIEQAQCHGDLEYDTVY